MRVRLTGKSKYMYQREIGSSGTRRWLASLWYWLLYDLSIIIHGKTYSTITINPKRQVNTSLLSLPIPFPSFVAYPKGVLFDFGRVCNEFFVSRDARRRRRKTLFYNNTSFETVPSGSSTSSESILNSRKKYKYWFTIREWNGNHNDFKL